MALAERAELVARLSLKDDFSGRLGAATARLKGMEGSLGRIAGHANRGLRTAATSLAKIGVVAGGFVALNVRSGINSLAELEDATTSVDGAIKQLGFTGRLTSQQVAGWANEIESDVQAAFDDKAITQAATTLLRFGKVTPQNLRPAMVVMTDLAAKTGDVDSAATLLAKALADPEKAAGRLTRQGIILTKAEQDQIKALVDAGKAGEAQALVLQSIERATKGAAAASKGPYRDALNTLTDVTEDAQRALGEAFLPLLQRVAKFLSGELAKPATIEKLRSFGRDLAGGFEKAIEVGKNIPWGLIGDSLQTAGKGAKAIFDAFTMLPPWVQTAVVTGWGLNKLTGGALGSIVGELGKGLIKGVLGMTAGIVNLRAGTVVGAGLGGAGGAAGAAATSGMAYQAGRVIGTAMKVFGVLAIAELASQLAPQINGLGAELGRKVPILLAERLALGKQLGELYWPFGPKGAPDWAGGTGVFGDTTHNRGTFDRVSHAPAPGTPTTRTGVGSIFTSERIKADVDWSNYPGIRPTTDRALTGSVFKAEQAKANIEWDKISGATSTSANRVTTALRDQKAALLSKLDRAAQVTRAVGDRSTAVAERTKAAVFATTAAVKAIPSPSTKVVVNTTTKVNVTANSITRTMITSGTWSAASVGAYNHAPAPI